jgi:predicted Zn-dependent peptidase
MRACFCFFAVVALTLSVFADEIPSRPENINVKPLNFTPPDVKQEKMENGGMLFVLPDSEAPLIKLFIIFRGGSMTDPKDKLGLCAFSVEMLKSGGCGSLSPEALDENIDSLGAHLSFSTEIESVTISLYVLSEEFEKALKLLFDILSKPRFDEEAIKSRKNIWLENLRQIYEHSSNIAGLLFKRALYSDSPYANPTEGLPETVSKISREDIVTWHKKWIQPQNMYIGLTGPVTDSTVSLVKEVFGKWKVEGENEKLPEIKIEQKEGLRIYLFERKGLEQVLILVGSLSAERAHPERPVLDALEYIIHTRINLKVREESGLAYSAYATHQACSKAGIFYAAAQTKTSTAVEALRLMVEQLRLAKTALPTTDAIRCIKDHFLNSFIFRFAEKGRLLQEVLWLKFYGFADDHLTKYCDRIRELGPDTLVEAGGKFINTDALTAVLVGEVSGLKNDLKKEFSNAKILELTSFDIIEVEKKKEEEKKGD